MRNWHASRKVGFTLAIAGLILSGSIMIGSVRSPSVLPLERDMPPRFDNVGDSFSFLVVSDSVGGHLTFNRILEKMSREEALFVIHLGDFVYNGRDYEYRKFFNEIRKLKIPVLTCPGNHEVKLGERGRKKYEKYLGPAQYSFSAGDAYFIVLDTSEGIITKDQVWWYENELKKSDSYRHRFFFTHMPLFDPRRGEYELGHSLDVRSDTDTLNWYLEHHRITMIFMGHIHAYYRGFWKKTPYIITGGGGQPLRGEGSEHNFHHYIRVTVSKDAVDYQVIKAESKAPLKLEHLLYDLVIIRDNFVWETLALLCVALIGSILIFEKRLF